MDKSSQPETTVQHGTLGRQCGCTACLPANFEYTVSYGFLKVMNLMW